MFTFIWHYGVIMRAWHKVGMDFKLVKILNNVASKTMFIVCLTCFIRSDLERMEIECFVHHNVDIYSVGGSEFYIRWRRRGSVIWQQNERDCIIGWHDRRSCDCNPVKPTGGLHFTEKSPTTCPVHKWLVIALVLWIWKTAVIQFPNVLSFVGEP